MSQSALILPRDRWINGRSMNKHVRTRHTVVYVCARARVLDYFIPSLVQVFAAERSRDVHADGHTRSDWEPAAREDRPEHTLFECHLSAPMQRKGRKTKTKQNKKRGKQQNPTLFQRKKK